MTAAIESLPDMAREEQPSNPLPATSGQPDDDMSRPLYFPVSLLKLAVMSVCTLGLYEFYWFYKNWRLIKAREEPETAPVWHWLFSVVRAGIFPAFFCYSLFTRIQDTADAEEVPVSLACGLLAVGWALSTILVRLPEAYWMFSFMTIIFLLPVQSAVNNINRTVNPKLDPNRRFTRWNIASVIAGCILIALILADG